jgi:hypothetical protein
MTERSRRRPHPAADARWASVAVAATLTCGGVAVLGLQARQAEAEAVAADLADAALPVAESPATVPPIVVIVPRVHVRAVTAPTVPAASAASAGSSTATGSWSPTPATVARAATTKQAPAVRTVRRVVRRRVRSKAS